MFRKLNMTKTGKIESIIHTFYAKQSQFQQQKSEDKTQNAEESKYV